MGVSNLGDLAQELEELSRVQLMQQYQQLNQDYERDKKMFAEGLDHLNYEYQQLNQDNERDKKTFAERFDHLNDELNGLKRVDKVKEDIIIGLQSKLVALTQEKKVLVEDNAKMLSNNRKYVEQIDQLELKLRAVEFDRDELKMKHINELMVYFDHKKPKLTWTFSSFSMYFSFLISFFCF